MSVQMKIAPEAADIMGALDFEAPEAEILKVDIELRLGMAGEEAPPQRGIVGFLGKTEQSHPGTLQGVAGGARSIDQNRGPVVVNQISRVARQVRN